MNRCRHEFKHRNEISKPHTQSDLSRNNNDTTSTTSSLQARKSATQDNNVTTTHAILKTLDKNEIQRKLISSVFEYEISSADALLMLR